MGVSPSAPIYRWIVSGIALVGFKLIVDKVLLVQTAFAKMKNCPGRVALWLAPFSPMAFALGVTFPRPGMAGYYAGKFSLYKKFGATTFASVRISTAQPFFWLADPEAIKLVVSDRHTFQKDVAPYEIVRIYGGNLANVALVWSESLRVVNEWFEQLDSAGPDVTVDVLLPMTQATLLVIAAAGFGRRVFWTAESTTEPPPGCKLTFLSAVTGTVNNLVFRALAPGWFYQFSSLIKVPYLSSRALFTQLAFDDLRTHMLDLVASARAEIASGEHPEASGAALLRNLVEANMNQDGDSEKLTEGEVLSNIFGFFLAGHGWLIFGFWAALVIQKLMSDRRDLRSCALLRICIIGPLPGLSAQTLRRNYSRMFSKEYTVACIRETLRVLPVEPRLSKFVHTDTVLPGTYFTPGSKESPVETAKFSMAIPAGSVVILDVWALHMNPLYWGEDAAEFKPERFIDTPSYQWPRNAFFPFSGGARSCIGQRFAFAEMVGILASVVRRYWIRVPDDLAKKPFEEQKEELLKWTTGMSLTPLNARVKLCRRV
ncbi:cytochrome P450 [Lanmaoa asiatica]|nr:cytochrome P450 [Lanmaoa asiatica]